MILPLADSEKTHAAMSGINRNIIPDPRPSLIDRHSQNQLATSLEQMVAVSHCITVKSRL